jgi:ABC-type lipoprotein release transport system permease subunit
MNSKSLNKDGTPRKKGSGRTKGSNSFTYIPLNDLQKIFNSEISIPVSRVWLRNLGYQHTSNIEKQEE